MTVTTPPRVLVTGGGRGIGRAVVDAFAASGARVVTCRRSPDPADGPSGGNGGDGGVTCVPVDLGEPGGAETLVGKAVATLGGLDVVVNNVGAHGFAPAAEVGDDEWARVMDLNVGATHRVVRAALDHLADGGSIVNVGAASALRGVPGATHHTAAKAALIGYTRALCKELGPRGIRVNTVAPGMVGGDDGAPSDPIGTRVAAMTPLGRLCSPADVAASVVFLAGPGSAFLTGITLHVDGGI